MKSKKENKTGGSMNLRTWMAIFLATMMGSTLIGCVTVSGGVSLGPDGKTAVLPPQSPLQIRSMQPELPPPPEPKKAKIVEERIEITEKVQFAYDDSTILSKSFDLLNDVALVMQQNPVVKKIRIEGHASSEGSASHNKALSDRRAKSVKDFLLNAGVSEDRMEAIGYGVERPIADNETEAGREKNRRVEFNIIERLTADELAALEAGSVSVDVSVDDSADADAGADELELE
jgi:outer membrane protein OmpA-like peptidoglycan-associated protein